MLLHFGVKPYMVFDGDYLPSKAATEASREKSRDEKKKLAKELLKAGKPSQATQEFQKCIDITPEMAAAVIQQLKKMNVDYVVAPYEADAQLVYLERNGLIDGIISDDSDLLVFGAKRLLTKLDQYGSCMEINRRDFCACREVSLTGWSDADFRRMAIMSGCDYLKGLPGVGLKTSYRMLRKSKTPERVVQMLQFQGTKVSENYLSDFYKAELTFLHQWVFCPIKKELVHLTELEGGRMAEEMPYIGAHVEPHLARAIADGDMNPITKLPIAHAPTPTKRRHSQTSTIAAPNPTPAKPINSYFKGRDRIPMGAMDPNCFSVDPQRVAQLTAGGLVPRVFPLPRPYLDDVPRPAPVRKSNPATRTSPRLQRRRTEPPATMRSQASSDFTPKKTVIGQQRSIPSAQNPVADQPSRPSKKARLCDDLVDQDKSPKQSKFFSQTKLLKSPRRAKSDAYLLSDDSIEEALQNLPDFDGWKTTQRSRKSIPIFEESTQVVPTEESQKSSHTMTTTAATARSATSQEQARHSTRPARTTTAISPHTLTTQANNMAQLGTPSNANLTRFSYNSSSTVATPLSAATSRRSSIFSAASTPSTGPSTGFQSSRPTALQRIAAKAFNGPVSPKPREREVKGRHTFLAGLPVNPSFVPLPKVDLDEVASLNQPCGSEDQIIHDSDGEVAEEDLDAMPTTKLNLSQFAFSR